MLDDEDYFGLDLPPPPTVHAATVPLIIAYGLGVDSTAMLVELVRLSRTDEYWKPKLILFADTGNEKTETYAYLPVMQAYLKANGFPPVVVVKNVVKDFKNWPPYHSLGENCLTNGTLPSEAFGFGSCSLKWKGAPQERYTKTWAPALACWASGQPVRKMIGYDATPKDHKRYRAAQAVQDDKYAYEYPLITWGWDRERCKAAITEAGLPVPPKSACYFCPNTRPDELLVMEKKALRYIVIMEARATPRLTAIQGLWRNGIKGTRKPENKKPGRMTDFIREKGLLPADEIDALWEQAPKMIVNNQEQHLLGLSTPSWHDFIEAFTPEDAVDTEPPLPRLSLPMVDED